MEPNRTIANLSYDDLHKLPAWSWTGQYDEEGNEVLIPVKFRPDGSIPASLGEIWCLCSCRFADGSENDACAMCRADTSLGPVGVGVWNGSRDIRLIFPPAPDFVLEKEGPLAFCKAFGLDPRSVFPLTIEVVPLFVTPPRKRSLRIEASGAFSFGVVSGNL